MIVALGCELQFANDITYFDESGHRFDQDPAPIGLNCQTCERHHCAQRAHHPLHVTLNFETHRRGRRVTKTRLAADVAVAVFGRNHFSDCAGGQQITHLAHLGLGRGAVNG